MSIEKNISRSVDKSYEDIIVQVPEEFRNWDVEYPEYKPVRYHVLDHIKNSRHPYAADPIAHVPSNPVRYADMVDLEGDFLNELTQDEWRKMKDRLYNLANEFKGTSKEFNFDENGYPLNPSGRTGIAGPGKLWEWGPILVADPIVTSEFTKPDGTKGYKLLCIKKSEKGKWSLPGGSRDRKDGLNYDSVDNTLTKELSEETGLTNIETNEGLDMSDAKLIFDGKTNTSRETDNSWMITTAKHKHLREEEFKKYVLQKGKDEGEGKEIFAKDWVEITPEFLKEMNPGHRELIKSVTDELGIFANN